MEDGDASLRPRKAPRTNAPAPVASSAPASEFLKGTVKKVRVHNFMSYSGTVSFTPGPRLNLVLGPNGTGKSTIVCALCVGLGGSNKILGRADSMADFVRGRSTKIACWTEITLSSGNEGQDYIVRRDIKATLNRDENGQPKKSCSSDWKINGADKALKDVLELTRRLGIQFDNLCQFLPQDKVVEFAKMNKFELLDATEKAVGDASLSTLHSELKDMAKALVEQEGSCLVNERQLDKLRVEHDRQQRDYERFNQRERLEKEIRLLQAKIAWLKVRSTQVALNASKAGLAQAITFFDNIVQNVDQDQRPAEQMRIQKDRQRLIRDKVAQDVRKLAKDVEDTNKFITDKRNDMESLIADRAALHNESQKMQARLNSMQKEVNNLQADLDKAPTHAPPELEDRFNAAVARQQELRNRKFELSSDRTDRNNEKYQLSKDMTNLTNDLNRKRDAKRQRLQLLEGRRRGIYTVWEWVQNNRQLFEHDVIGPVGVEIVCQNERHASYLEKQCFPKLFDFVTKSQNDEMVLTNYIKQHCSGLCSVATVVEAGRRQLNHKHGHAGQYTNIGITHTLDQVFDAPDEVKLYLGDYCGIGEVFVCADNLKIADADRILKALPGSERGGSRQLYIGSDKMTLSFSKYNQSASQTAMMSVTQSILLRGSAPSGMDAEIQGLEQRMAALQQKIHAIDQALERISAEEAEVGKAELDAVSLANQLSSEANKITKRLGELKAMLKARSEVLRLEVLKPEPMSKEGPITAKLKTAMQMLTQLANKTLDQLQKVWKQSQDLVLHELMLKEFEMQEQHLRVLADARELEKRKAEREKKRIEAMVESDRAAHNHAKSTAEHLSPMNAEMKELLRQEPSEEMDVQGLIEEKIEEMEAIVSDNPNVIQEYKERERTIDTMTQEQANFKQHVADTTAAITEKRNRWLPPLQDMVNKINESFETNFAELGCAGDVKLFIPDNHDYSNYAIEIRVKYREGEELQLLTANRQSGGERSVATILYLIALQGLTVTPFRVVDEINQGMDPVNERAVFVLLVESACKPNTPQCFLLTPKLLPGLPFTEDITILTIMNGAHIEESLVKDFNKKEALYGNRFKRLRGVC